MSHIFVSYSHKDSAYAHKLASYMDKLGLDPWIDDRIDYGSIWPREIEERVDTCDAFILIMTPNSYNSNWVQSELTRAQEKGKPIFPLLLEGNRWISVQAIQCVDVTDGELPPERFFANLAQAILDAAAKRGIKLPEVIHLPRIVDGRKLVDVFRGAHAYRHTYDEPENDYETKVISRFFDSIDEIDIMIEEGRGLLVRYSKELTDQIRELESVGFHVYAKAVRQPFKLKTTTIENWIVAILVLSRQLSDSIPFIIIPED